MKIQRSDQSRFAAWWFTVDTALLSGFAALVGVGIVLSLAASPAVAAKKGLPLYHFVERHLLFAAVGSAIMFAVSLLSPTGVRRLALGVFAAALGGLIAVQVFGVELNGAKRWLSIAGFSLQPSEFIKPAAIVLFAWLFSEAVRRPDVPALPIAGLLWLLVAGLLAVQPDVGQTVLLSFTAGALYFLSGLPLIGVAVLAALGLAGLAGAYAVFPHVAARIDHYFAQGSAADNSQIARALQSFAEGGFLGRGPGEGTIKSVLPDAHTDFIFSVVAEEYGAVACLALVALFAFVVLRALLAARREPQPFIRLAIQGLSILIAAQALINMGVNVGLLPAKGMTLPFISAGGSSLLGLSLTAGMVLALTRRRADAHAFIRQPEYAPAATVSIREQVGA